MNDLIQQSTQRVGIIEEIGYSYYTTMHTGIDILKKRFLNSTLPEKERIAYSNQMQQFQYESNRLTQRALYWMRKHMRKMVSDQRKCLNKLLQVRSSSVCYACSRKGKYFFTKNMLNVNINQCRDVISECSHSWLYLLQFLDRVNTFLRESQRLQRWIGVDFEKALPNGRTTSVFNWAKEADMVGKLNRCKDGQCSFSTAKDICNAFLSYKRPVYLKEALRMMVAKDANGETIDRSVSRDSHSIKAAEYFGKVDLMKVKQSIDKYLARNAKNGRKLLSMPGSTQPRTSLATARPAGTFTQSGTSALSSLATGTAAATQQVTASPLLCGSSIVCNYDLVIQEVSKCTLSGIGCADTGTCYV